MTPDLAALLPVARYRLEFEVTKPLHLPAYAGSTLRGAWGGALRRMACVTSAPSCEGCRLLVSCPYTVIFETRPSLHQQPSLQNFSQLPRPYVIEPPQMGERDYAPGERLVFHIVLTGRALNQLPLILLAHVHAFRQGVGRGDGTAQLLRVVHEGSSETVVLEGPHGRLLDHAPDLPITSRVADAASLRFYTPLRLQTNGRRASAEELTARKLLMALIRRIALLCEFHGAGPLELDFADLGRRAEAIRSETRLRWQDWARYSNRQKTKINLGGLIGEWRLYGDLGPFAPFLHLGQWLHVGKEATFGMGGYRLTA
jgi:hypothetical protein